MNKAISGKWSENTYPSWFKWN